MRQFIRLFEDLNREVVSKTKSRGRGSDRGLRRVHLGSELIVLCFLPSARLNYAETDFVNKIIIYFVKFYYVIFIYKQRFCEA